MIDDAKITHAEYLYLPTKIAKISPIFHVWNFNSFPSENVIRTLIYIIYLEICTCKFSEPMHCIYNLLLSVVIFFVLYLYLYWFFVIIGKWVVRLLCLILADLIIMKTGHRILVHSGPSIVMCYIVLGKPQKKFFFCSGPATIEGGIRAWPL